MKQDMDKIIFESRNEIKNIKTTLDEYIEEHKGKDDLNTVQRLSDLLEAMYITW